VAPGPCHQLCPGAASSAHPVHQRCQCEAGWGLLWGLLWLAWLLVNCLHHGVQCLALLVEMLSLSMACRVALQVLYLVMHLVTFVKYSLCRVHSMNFAVTVAVPYGCCVCTCRLRGLPSCPTWQAAARRLPLPPSRRPLPPAAASSCSRPAGEELCGVSACVGPCCLQAKGFGAGASRRQAMQCVADRSVGFKHTIVVQV
jgi:hypothetical protein